MMVPFELTFTTYCDLTGIFLYKLLRGNLYKMVIDDHDSNIVHRKEKHSRKVGDFQSYFQSIEELNWISNSRITAKFEAMFG